MERQGMKGKAMAKPDFTYRPCAGGMFLQIMPETREAQSQWGMIAEATGGTGKILFLHLDQVKAQFKAAGYTLHKARPERDKMTDDELLEALAE